MNALEHWHHNLKVLLFFFTIFSDQQNILYHKKKKKKKPLEHFLTLRKCPKDLSSGISFFQNSISRLSIVWLCQWYNPMLSLAALTSLHLVMIHPLMMFHSPFSSLKTFLQSQSWLLLWSLTDQILNELKEDQFYHDICQQLSSNQP